MVYTNHLCGYILEELLAYFIKKSGYFLLVNQSQDFDNLFNKGAGLFVKGRGGEHQVDVLGQLKWTPTFANPIRLFIESKFRSENKIVLNCIRNAIGILHDLNQKTNKKDFEDSFENLLKPNYTYVYALFSTTGFTDDAIKMALTHQIVLVDLSSVEYDDLKAEILRTSREINKSRIKKTEYLVSKIRACLRKELRTCADEDNHLLHQLEIQESDYIFLKDLLKQCIRITKKYSNFFIGMAQGSFILLLKSRETSKFVQYAMKRPKHKVSITYNRSINDGKTWQIKPIDYGDDDYSLTFVLPESLATYIFEITDAEVRKRALSAKERFLSSIAIYHQIDEKEFLFRLEFDKGETLNQINR